MSLTLGDFLNTRLLLREEVKNLLGFLANTESSNHSKGWEAVANKLNERYTALNYQAIMLFKSRGIGQDVDQFLNYCGSLCVTVDDFVWALCYSGNDFVANKIVAELNKSQSIQKSPFSSIQNTVDLYSSHPQMQHNTNQSPHSQINRYSMNQSPPAPSNQYNTNQNSQIPAKQTYMAQNASFLSNQNLSNRSCDEHIASAPKPICEQAPPANFRCSNVGESVSAETIAQQASLLAQFNPVKNTLARQFLTPHKYVTLYRQLGVQGLANIMDWRTFSYKLPNLKYASISHLYHGSNNVNETAKCFIKWWLSQDNSMLSDLYKALKAIGYNRLLDMLELSENTVVNRPIPQPVNNNSLVKDVFDFHKFDQLCEYLKSTNQWKNVCKQLGIAENDVNITSLICKDDAIEELLAKWSETPNSTVKRLHDVLKSTSNSRIIHDLNVFSKN